MVKKMKHQHHTKHQHKHEMHQHKDHPKHSYQYPSDPNCPMTFSQWVAKWQPSPYAYPNHWTCETMAKDFQCRRDLAAPCCPKGSPGWQSCYPTHHHTKHEQKDDTHKHQEVKSHESGERVEHSMVPHGTVQNAMQNVVPHGTNSAHGSGCPYLYKGPSSYQSYIGC